MCLNLGIQREERFLKKKSTISEKLESAAKKT
ncbi:MAG: hypothetical protein Ct9H300mP3_03880 [Gammaproteobacteria bacterium]|nr:MAG: hypothetical protein Ct9H300mP3_03880 [Gammaproteobacteria bacterium]